MNWVEIELGKADFDHLISPEERLNLAMMRQQDRRAGINRRAMAYVERCDGQRKAGDATAGS